jgi:hypothetical protein
MSYKIIDRDWLTDEIAHEMLRLWKENDYLILEAITEGRSGLDQTSDEDLIQEMRYWLSDETIEGLFEKGIVKEVEDE